MKILRLDKIEFDYDNGGEYITETKYFSEKEGYTAYHYANLYVQSLNIKPHLVPVIGSSKFTSYPLFRAKEIYIEGSKDNQE